MVKAQPPASFPVLLFTIIAIIFAFTLLEITLYRQTKRFTFQNLIDAYPTPKFTCPQTEWIDCMPVVDAARKYQCQPPYLNWAKANCPGFQGAAL